MLPMRKGIGANHWLYVLVSDDSPSSLKPEELKVLRDQYEKEGSFVGVQTKFNYAWV